MKTNILLVTLLMLALLTGCKKTSNQIAITSEITTTSTLADSQVEAKIKNFILKIKSGDKEMTTMSVEETIWNIEAALNYSLCKPYISQDNLMIDSLIINLPTDNGLIGSTDIQGAYQSCLNKMNGMVISSPYAKSHFAAADLSLKNTELTSVTLKLIVVLAENGENPGKSLLGFGSSDNWEWGFDMGKCSVPHGTSDAAKQIQSRINNNQVFQQGTYFTDVEIKYNVDAFSYSIPADYNYDNIDDNLMFSNYTAWPNFHECIPYTEMNFYLNGTNTVFYRYVANGGPRPAGKIPIYILDFWGDQDPSLPNYNIFHIGNFQYGIAHINNGG